MEILDPSHRTVYRGHLISWRPTDRRDGRFVARATIVSLGSEKTVSQRFLDLETFATFAEAAKRGGEAAVGWVDAELRARPAMAAIMAVASNG